jgi:glycine/D-amino acid oxidase-like deaminating enzyme
MKVIVIGAGVLGVSAARRLSVAGAEVVLLDHRGAGTGTSATTFAQVDSNRKHDVDYHGLNVAGMQEHARLAERLPGRGPTSRAGPCTGRTRRANSGW